MDGTFANTASGVPVPAFSSIPGAIAAGVPAVRLSNIFVRQFGAAEWLKKGRPAHPRFAEIPYFLSRLIGRSDEQALQEGRFGLAGDGPIPMTDGPVQRDYRLATPIWDFYGRRVRRAPARIRCSSTSAASGTSCHPHRGRCRKPWWTGER